MSTTKHWRSRKNGTKRKNSSLVSNWTNCWCSGSRKHRGLEKPRRTHYSKRFSTSIRPTRISSRSEPSSRSSTRKECEIRFENRTKSASSWNKGTTASNCQRLGGYATVHGEIRSVTVSQSAGQWYVSVNTFEQVEPPRHASTAVVGFDWGVAQLLTPSEGRPVDRLSPLKTFLPQLKTLQRRLARSEVHTSELQ